MTPQHLSDEAVAAFADGVLTGRARDRAARHLNDCAECRQAVKTQREAAFALRHAAAPALPTGLLDKLRTVPQTTPITTLPTAVGPDGSTVLSTFAPMAALVPPERTEKRRTKPFLTAAALVGAAGALVAGVAASDSGSAGSGSHPVRPVNHVEHQPGGERPGSVLWGNRP
jgi:anti-sigma factor RsiW